LPVLPAVGVFMLKQKFLKEKPVKEKNFDGLLFFFRSDLLTLVREREGLPSRVFFIHLYR